MRIIHITEDYEYGLTYHCHQQNNEGICSDVTLDLIGRSTTFPEDLWNSIVKRLNEFCIDEDEVKRLSHEGNNRFTTILRLSANSMIREIIFIL